MRAHTRSDMIQNTTTTAKKRQRREPTHLLFLLDPVSNPLQFFQLRLEFLDSGVRPGGVRTCRPFPLFSAQTTSKIGEDAGSEAKQERRKLGTSVQVGNKDALKRLDAIYNTESSVRSHASKANK